MKTYKTLVGVHLGDSFIPSGSDVQLSDEDAASLLAQNAIVDASASVPEKKLSLAEFRAKMQAELDATVNQAYSKYEHQWGNGPKPSLSESKSYAKPESTIAPDSSVSADYSESKKSKRG